jgi:hypothetical protein
MLRTDSQRKILFYVILREVDRAKALSSEPKDLVLGLLNNPRRSKNEILRSITFRSE